MEDSSLVSDTLKHFRDAATRHPRTRLAIQAALRRTPLDLEALAPKKPRIRLVKGAYAERIDVAHHGRGEIRAQYKYLTDWLFEYGSDPRLRHARQRADQLCPAGRGESGQGAQGVRDPAAVRYPQGPPAAAGG
jgi:proline dehydrogenase